MRKILCLLLIVLLMVPFVTSCKTDKDESNSSTTSSGDGNIPGLEKKRYDGTKIKILTVNEERKVEYSDYEFAAETTEDENAVKSAVSKRTQLIKDNYGFEIEVSKTNDPTGDIKKAIQSGDNSFHLVADALSNITKAGVEGLFWDLSNVPNLNLQNSWWDQSVINDLSTANYKFYLSGDLMVTDKTATWVCFFNKKLIKDFNLEDPYDLVKNNNWNIDKLYEMSKVVSEGNKGLGEVTFENGTFGYVCQTYDCLASMISFNQKMVTKDENDYPLLNIKNEDTYTKFTKIYDVMMDKNTTYLFDWDSDNGTNIFYGGRGLFLYNKLQFVQSLNEKSVPFEYGVLPLPKFNANQDKYYSTCTVYWNFVLAVPCTVPKEELEPLGYFLEVMGYYGQKYVKPAFYEKTVKLQKFNDARDEEMLDIIFANRIFDLASVYDYGSALYMYTSIICSKNNSIAATVEQNEAAIQAKIDDSIEIFKNLDTTKK